MKNEQKPVCHQRNDGEILKFSSITGLSVFFSGLLAIAGAAIIYFDVGIPLGDVEISYSQLIDQDVDQKIDFLKSNCL